MFVFRPSWTRCGVNLPESVREALTREGWVLWTEVPGEFQEWARDANGYSTVIRLYADREPYIAGPAGSVTEAVSLLGLAPSRRLAACLDACRGIPTDELDGGIAVVLPEERLRDLSLRVYHARMRAMGQKGMAGLLGDTTASRMWEYVEWVLTRVYDELLYPAEQRLEPEQNGSEPAEE